MLLSWNSCDGMTEPVAVLEHLCDNQSLLPRMPVLALSIVCFGLLADAPPADSVPSLSPGSFHVKNDCMLH